MKLLPPHIKFGFIILVGLLMVSVLSALMDYIVYRSNQTLDGEPGFSPDEYERYKVQAVEAHVIGTGWALILTMALMVAWIDKWRFPKA